MSHIPIIMICAIKCNYQTTASNATIIIIQSVLKKQAATSRKQHWTTHGHKIASLFNWYPHGENWAIFIRRENQLHGGSPRQPPNQNRDSDDLLHIILENLKILDQYQAG